MHIFNIRLRRVGGILFLQFGRIHLSFCISREFKSWHYPPTTCTALVPAEPVSSYDQLPFYAEAR